MSITAVLVVWELLSRSGLVDMSLFPPPSQVFLTLSSDIRSGLLPTDVAVSLARVLIGFVAGSVLGSVLGIWTGISDDANSTAGQILHLVRPLPPIAIVPLVVLWFGTDEPAKWFLVAFGVVFPVWINVHTGVRHIPSAYIWTARSMGASGALLVRTVYLPATAPYLFTGLRTSLGIAFFCLVAAEATGASYGIMYRVDMAELAFRSDRVLEGLVLLGILSACMDSLLMLTLRFIAPSAFILDLDEVANAPGNL